MGAGTCVDHATRESRARSKNACPIYCLPRWRSRAYNALRRINCYSYVDSDFNKDGKGNYDTKDKSCYAEYNAEDEDKTPMVGRKSGFKYVYKDDMSDITNYDGYGPEKYGTGGQCCCARTTATCRFFTE